MAKMFYSLEEAATKLGMDAAEVQSLAESGQLQEFRDRDKLMFKVEQVDLLAGDDDDEIMLSEDTAAGGIDPISLSASGSASAFNINMESAADATGTGVSIFEPEDGAADANADTLVSGGGLGASGFAMDAGASGSGLAQLAFEPDDTSLGSNLLDDLAADSQSGGSMGASALGESALGASVPGALFEGASDSTTDFAAAGAAGAMPMMMGEAYDGPASGLFGGMALGIFLLLAAALGVMILGMSGGTAGLLGSVDTNMLYMIAGGGFVVVLFCSLIGWVMLRKS